MLKLSGMTLDRFKSLARRTQLPFLENEELDRYTRITYTVEKAALLAVQRVLMDDEGLPPDAARSMAGNLYGDAYASTQGDWFTAAANAPADLWLIQRVIELDDGEILRGGREFGPVAEAMRRIIDDRGYDTSVVRFDGVNVSAIVRRVLRLLEKD